jgi:hypothetical protein
MTSDDDYFRAGEGIDALREINLDQTPSALQRLGPPPFRKSGFPIIGFLATLYDHVSAHVASDMTSPPPSGD